MTLAAGQHNAELSSAGSIIDRKRFWIVSGQSTTLSLRESSQAAQPGSALPPTVTTPVAPAATGPAGNPPAAAGSQNEALTKLFARIPNGVMARTIPKGGTSSHFINSPDNIPKEAFDVQMLHFVDDDRGATAADAAAAKNFPELRELYLTGNSWTGEELAALKGHPKVARVEIQRPMGNSPVPSFKPCRAIPHLLELPALSHVVIDSGLVTDQDVALLKGNTNIRDLWLLADGLTPEGLAALGTLPSLEVLALKWVKPGSRGPVDDDLKLINRLRNLRVLRLEGCPELTGAGFEKVDALPMLSSLQLDGAPKWNDAGSELLARAAPNLTGFSLNFKEPAVGERTQAVSAVTDRSLEALKPLERMRTVRIEGATGITDEGLKSIATMANLEYLFLRGSSITSAGIPALTGLANLRYVSLGQTMIDDRACDELAKIPKLTTLALDFTSLTDAGLSKLGPLLELRNLNLAQTRVKRQGVDEFKKTHPDCYIIR